MSTESDHEKMLQMLDDEDVQTRLLTSIIKGEQELMAEDHRFVTLDEALSEEDRD